MKLSAAVRTIFNNVKLNLTRMSVYHLLYLVFLSFATMFFLAYSLEQSQAVFSDYGVCLILLFLIMAGIFLVWLFLIGSGRDAQTALRNAVLSLSPVMILVLVIPYNFLYSFTPGIKTGGVLTVVLLGIGAVHYVLNSGNPDGRTGFSARWALVFLCLSYTLYFGGIAVLRHLNYQNSSSFDVALYSQIQWNNLHGRFFQSSMSGSNFVTHNSLFLLLLTPFYALYPAPETLIFLKTVFIAAGVFPLYLILKENFKPGAMAPMALSYLFYPYIVGQNFNAPHEMCFLPPFLLFAYYFFVKERFGMFLVFLLVSLSVKEHLAMIAVMFGLYALLRRRSWRWVITPLVIGCAWAVFSLWIIFTFQKFYHVDQSPAWLIENIKDRFLIPGSGILESMGHGLRTSILGTSNGIWSLYTLFSPAGVVLPLFSPVVLLGMPELAINCLASITLLYATWHYNIIVAIFILLASFESVKHLAARPWGKNDPMERTKKEELLSWFLCFCIFGHFFFWWDGTKVTFDPGYVRTMNKAIAMIPKDTSVTAPKGLVAYLSDRKDYFLLTDDRKGEYALLDDKWGGADFPLQGDGFQYHEIFNENGVRVYKSGSFKNKK